MSKASLHLGLNTEIVKINSQFSSLLYHDHDTDLYRLSPTQDCRHSNIVAYFGSYLRRDKLWICMEYCGGGSLQVSTLLFSSQQHILNNGQNNGWTN